MGQYKVPQNVEAEDKILGPLTFKQFIYAIIGVAWGLICFAVFRSVPALAIIIGAPPTILFMLLAFYTRDGQNFEQYLIALVGFFAASHRRLWVKEDVAETFHVEPTKHAAEATQRNPREVRSELEKLATLIDSRGWNRPPEPEHVAGQILPAIQHSDRLIVPTAQPAPSDEPGTDILDLQSSPLAQNLTALLAAAAADVRKEALSQMTARANASAAQASIPTSTSGVTATPTNDILKLATQSDDLTVAQLAAQATRLVPAAPTSQVEVPTNGR